MKRIATLLMLPVAATLALAVPASAQMRVGGVSASSGLPGGDVQPVQWRPGGFGHGGWGHGGWGHGGWGRPGWGGGWHGAGWGGPRYGYGYGGYGYGGWGTGAGVAAGLATGVIVGGALAASQAPYYSGRSAYVTPGVDASSVAYCQQRFRSYDINSGTYLGYDGMRHSCP